MAVVDEPLELARESASPWAGVLHKWVTTVDQRESPCRETFATQSTPVRKAAAQAGAARASALVVLATTV
jgi:hypothetical protein